MVEINERVGRPQLLLQLLARDHFPCAVQQQRQDLERLPLEPKFEATLAQFASLAIEFKDSEANDSVIGLRRCLRGRRSLAPGGWSWVAAQGWQECAGEASQHRDSTVKRLSTNVPPPPCTSDLKT